MDMQAWLQENLETFSFADEQRPYVRIRPFVDALGLEWERERAFLAEDDHWAYREAELVPGQSETIVQGLPADKLFVYLKMIDPEAVREELREKIREYQETSRRMTERAFLNSDLLAAARAKSDPSPLERKLIEAAEMLEKRDGS